MSVNIYVGNLSYDLSETQLEEFFNQYGEVSSVKIITDHDTGRSKGFGFVEMSDKNEAENAISELDGKDVLGRNLKVNPAKPKNENKSFDRY